MPGQIRRFSVGASSHHQRRMSNIMYQEGHFKANLTTLYLGVSAILTDDHTAAVAIAVHDTTYLIDFSLKHIPLDDAMISPDNLIADFVISEAERYEHENFAKFIGAGLPTTLEEMCPRLCSRLWLDMDIIPIVIHPTNEPKKAAFWDGKHVDEQADSMARKCIL